MNASTNLRRCSVSESGEESFAAVGVGQRYALTTQGESKKMGTFSTLALPRTPASPKF